MSAAPDPSPEMPTPASRLGAGTISAVLGFYVAALAAATYPVLFHIGSVLPGFLPDALMHLWVMRWYRICLLEGQWPWFCPDIQYPVGAPLGKFSPLHFQGLLYLLLSSFTSNDTLCYNLLWTAGFLLTGFGTFLLIWYVLRHRLVAAVGGLMAMLCGSMMVHAPGHLELLYVGWFPIFLVAWMRLVDHPSPRRLMAASALFVLVAMGAAYFMIQAIVPASLYVVWRAVPSGRVGWKAWSRRRVGWFAGFVALSVPALAVLFSAQFWASAHGFSVHRPESHYAAFTAPIWSYAVPTSQHRLARLLPFDLYEAALYGGRLAEAASYLGIVVLALLYFAAVRRVRFPLSAFWWTALALMVVLAVGPWWTLGSTRISLPARWLWNHVFIFRWTRNPGRFNLFATVFAALIAAAALRELLRHARRPWVTPAVCGALSLVAILDLGVRLPACIAIPTMPDSYRYVTRNGARPTLLEIPVIGSAMPINLTSACGYWQSYHRARTTGGYSGNDNIDLDNRLYHTSPFSWRRPSDPRFDQITLADPGYLADPADPGLNVVRGVGFDDYAWLFLQVHKFDYVVLHKWDDEELGANGIAARERLRQRLQPMRVFEDDRTVVYDAARFRAPSRPVLLCTDGFRFAHPWQGRRVINESAACAVDRKAHMAFYNPDPSEPVTLAFAVSAFRKHRIVRLMSGGRELGRWSVAPGSWSSIRTEPFQLPAGRQSLSLISDDEALVRRDVQAAAEADHRPYSLLLSEIRLNPTAAPLPIPAMARSSAPAPR